MGSNWGRQCVFSGGSHFERKRQNLETPMVSRFCLARSTEKDIKAETDQQKQIYRRPCVHYIKCIQVSSI